MFHSARLKLTAWYVLIIMFISVLFSITIYVGIHNELRRFEHIQRQRIELELNGVIPPSVIGRRSTTIDPDMIVETRNRLTLVLVLVNFGILVVSAGAAYFLAGRTLNPIKEMIDEQNRFISDASHELRTPLTALRAEIEVNLRDKNLTFINAKKLLESNLEEVVNLQTLSDNLMQLTQYQKKNGGLPMEEISLREITERAVKKISPLAQQKHVLVKNQVSGDTVKGNRQSLMELFIILLDNAIKYSRPHTNVFLTSDKVDHKIIVRVKDSGVGIAQSDLPHIFDRFYRVDKSRSKEKVTGYGLGLAIARKIVDIHEGTITAESVVDKGTTITITF